MAEKSLSLTERASDQVLRWPTSRSRNWTSTFLDSAERNGNIVAAVAVTPRLILDPSIVGGMQGIYFTRDPAMSEPVQPPDGTQWTPASANFLFSLGAPVNGVYRSASDPRKDGHAVGW